MMIVSTEAVGTPALQFPPVNQSCVAGLALHEVCACDTVGDKAKRQAIADKRKREYCGTSHSKPEPKLRGSFFIVGFLN